MLTRSKKHKKRNEKGECNDKNQVTKAKLHILIYRFNVRTMQQNGNEIINKKTDLFFKEGLEEVEPATFQSLQIQRVWFT